MAARLGPRSLGSGHWIGPASLELVRVCREGEAWAIAAGLHLAGRRPLVMIQNTGLFESGDAMRNVLFDLRLPLSAIVGYRSFLIPNSTDSAKRFTEPVSGRLGAGLHNRARARQSCRGWRTTLRACVKRDVRAWPWWPKGGCKTDVSNSRFSFARTDMIRIDRFSRMPLVAALEVLAGLRTDQIVVTTMGVGPRVAEAVAASLWTFTMSHRRWGRRRRSGLGLALAKPSARCWSSTAMAACS